MKRRKRIALTILLLITISAGSVFARTAQNVSSVFQTGSVKIALDQQMKLGGKELPFSAPPSIVPGQRISMIPRVTNMAEPCYIRARVVIQNAGQSDRQVELKDCYGQGENWVNRGEYLYYIEILKAQQQAELFQGIKLPDTWTNTTASGFKINITAEAVQAKNIRPEFQNERPWGRIETELSQVGDNYKIGSSQKSYGRGVDIIYEDGAKSFIINPETFFSDSESLMPGDLCNESLRLENTAGKKIQVLFKATCKDSDLLRKVRLVIKQGKRKLYAGPLVCDQLRDYSTLAVLKKEEKQNIDFYIKVPAELKNTYQELRDQVTWWFTVQDINGNTVQTGDDCFGWFSGGLLLLSLITICIITKRRRVNEKSL